MSEGPIYNEGLLLRELAAGSETAFKTIFDHYRPKLFSYILQLSDSREIAEDVVHDVFLHLWAKRENFKDVGNLNAYIYRMVQNKAINGFKRLANETLIVAELSRRPAGTTDPAELLSYKELLHSLQDAVEELTPQQKQVYILSRQRGLKQEEIASQLKISVLTVKKHLTDALRYLRIKIGTATPGVFFWLPLGATLAAALFIIL